MIEGVVVKTAESLPGNANTSPRRRSELSVFLFLLRACLKIPWGPVFAEKAGWRGATREHPRSGAVTEKQRSQPAFSAKTLRAAVLLTAAGVGLAATAR